MTRRMGIEKENEFNGIFAECIAEGSDYKRKLHGIIDDLFARVKSRPIEETIEDVRKVTDSYVEETEERPDVIALDRMATLILNETYTDTHPDKMAREEYPVLTETQREEREKDEIPLIWADEVDSDGRDRRPQTRDNNRKVRDLTGGHLPPKSVIKANRERKKRRREATKASQVVTYYLD